MSALSPATSAKPYRPRRGRTFCSWMVGRVVRDMIYPRVRAKKVFTRLLNALGGDKAVTRSIAGQRLLVVPSRSIVEFRMAVCGTYEPVLTSYLASTLQPGMIFVDVGAHIGFFTLLAADRVGAGGRVISFEPHPRNFECLRDNVELNGYSNVTALPRAVAAAPGSMRLHFPHDDSAFTTMADVSSDASADVAVDTVDRSLRELEVDRCDVMKIDIEGAELLALRGMVETIAKNPPPQLVIEVHTQQIRRLGGTAVELVEFLRGYGYELFKLDDSGVLEPLASTAALTDAQIGGYLVCLPGRGASH